nr:ABC-type transport auxiliary lipoprotein family protein [Marivita sp. S6314]
MTFSVSGCATLSALSDAATPLEAYELRSPSDIPVYPGRPRPLDVIVELPTSTGSLATDRIMIRPNPLQAQYLPEVRWSDPTPVMVQNLLLRAVEATGVARYAGRTPIGPGGDYAIVTELVDFHAEANTANDTALIRQSLVVRLVRERDAAIVTSRRFDAQSPSATLETQDLITAFDTASDTLLSDFANWISRELARR